MDSLTNVGVSVNNESKDGNFIILDTPKGFQIGTFGPYKFARSLLIHTVKDRKSTVFIVSDLESFLLTERTTSM